MKPAPVPLLDFPSQGVAGVQHHPWLAVELHLSATGQSVSHSDDKRRHGSHNSMEWTVGNPDSKPFKGQGAPTTVVVQHESLADFHRYLFQAMHQTQHGPLPSNRRQSIRLYADQPKGDRCVAHDGLRRLLAQSPRNSRLPPMADCSDASITVKTIRISTPRGFMWAASRAYLGPFTLQGYIDNGNRFFEGESKGYNGSYSVLTASYTWHDWQFSTSLGQSLR